MEPASGLAKNTFLNLPAAKRERILAEAVREFAECGFQRASVNAIVRRAGIAKGSLYQYFANKEGLFRYVFGEFTRLVKNEVKLRVGRNPDGDFFAVVRQVLQAGIRFIDSHPDYFRLYLRLLSEREVPGRRELLGRVRLFSGEFFGPLCRRAQQQGRMRPDIPPEAVVFVLDATMDRFLLGYAESHLDNDPGLARVGGEDVSQTIDGLIAILADGLNRREEESWNRRY